LCRCLNVCFGRSATSLEGRFKTQTGHWAVPIFGGASAQAVCMDPVRAGTAIAGRYEAVRSDVEICFEEAPLILRPRRWRHDSSGRDHVRALVHRAFHVMDFDFHNGRAYIRAGIGFEWSSPFSPNNGPSILPPNLDDLLPPRIGHARFFLVAAACQLLQRRRRRQKSSRHDSAGRLLRDPCNE
jgi:hypothetical protein